jgi:cytochrome c oxidase cbb3-type subunit 2
MNSGPLLFLGLFITMACSWLSFVMGPQLQIGNLTTTTNIFVGGLGQIYPHTEPGAAHQGAEVYRANGCAACHTEQVRPAALGSDLNRGWGIRRSTAYDYLFEQPVMLGTLRVGPDLANAARRMSAGAVLLRLYEPRAITPGSVMPPYRFLFDLRKIKDVASTNALEIPPAFAPEAGYEVIPKPAAISLAAYIMSLHQDGYLFEAPPPPGMTNASAIKPKAGTNFPAK